MKITKPLSVIKRLILFVLIGITLFGLSSRLDDYRNYQGLLIAIYTISISCVILLTGFSGQLSLGQGAFMAIGAYTAAISFTNFNLAPFLSLVAAVLVSAISGLLIGFALVRFTGAYLSGTTLALAFSLPALLSTSTFFGAGEGIEFALGNPLENSFVTFQSQDQTYFAIGALAALISLFFIFNIVNAKYGRIWKSIRDNEVAAALNGINVNRYKLMAFSLSSGFSGLAGALFAISINAATPSAFPLSLSLLILTGAVVTGLYNLKTVVFGAFVVVILPSLAEAVVTGRENSERLGVALPSLLVSGLLVLTILVSPNGPAGIFHKKMTN